MRKRSLILALFVLLVAACASLFSPGITLEVLNRDDYFLTGDLEIKACLQGLQETPDLNTLAVNIYVTENQDWRNHPAGLPPYDDYVNPELVGIPGTLSEPIPTELWQPLGEGCYLAKVENVFVERMVGRICPIEAIVIVASFDRGRLNGAQAFECLTHALDYVEP